MSPSPPRSDQARRASRQERAELAAATAKDLQARLKQEAAERRRARDDSAAETPPADDDR